MIKVKQTGLPVVGAHWSYGPDHMRQISLKTARGLCGMYPLPAMGCATIVAFKPHPSGFASRLEIQNVSGDFYLASVSEKVSEWPATFGVEVSE